MTFLKRVMCLRSGLISLLLIAATFEVESQTQNFSIVQYTTKEGLSNNEVLDVLQDRNGFIWIATANGLNRYDGYEFINFYSNQADSSTLSNNHCTRIVEDTTGVIWVSTLHGLNSIDPKFLKIKRYYNVIPAHTGIGSTEGNIASDRKGNIFYCGQHDIMKWNYKSHLFEPFYPEIMNAYRDSISDIFGIYLDSKNNYWIYVRRGFYLVDSQHHKLITAIDEKPNIQVHDILEAPDGTFYLATWAKRLLKFDPKTFSITYLLNTDSLWKDNVITKSIAASKLPGAKFSFRFSINEFGIGIYDGEQNRFHKIRFENLPVFKNNNSRITKIFIDRQDNTWCVSDRGVFKIINRQADIWNGEYDYLKAQNSLAEYVQVTHSQNTDELIIRDEKNKLYLFNTVTLKHQLLDHIKCRNKQFKLPPVYLFSVDRLNRIWIFTNDNDIVCWDRAADTLFTVRHSLGKDLNGFPRYYTSAFVDHSGKVWLATLAGLHYLQEGRVFKYDFGSEFQKHGQHFSPVIGKILDDNRGNLWVSRRFSWEGKKACISRVNLRNNSFETFYKDNLPGSLTTDNDFFDMVIDRTGKLWICNVDGLVTCKSDDPKPSFLPVGQQAPFNYGLPRKLLLFNDSLIILSNAGIFLLNTGDGKVVRKYDERDGLFSLDELRSVYKLSDSRILVNYSTTYQIIDLKMHDIALDLPKPMLISIKIKEKDFVEYENASGRGPFVSNIVMAPGIRDLILKFTSNEFSDGINQLFSWKLDGFEQDWSKPDFTNHVNYNNLEPGNYVFQLKVVDQNGREGEILKIPVDVQPYFYQTVWFKGLIILSLIGLTYLLFLVRIRRIRQKAEQQTMITKQLAELEMQALRTQMNPHFLFNCLNSIQRFILENENKVAINYLAKFSRLVRLILENSRDKKVSLSKEMESLDLYIQMEKLRFDHNFSFTIDMDDAIDTEFTKITPMILQPFVENAIWHGLQHKEGNGKISIRVSESKEAMLFTIEDNGIGRKASAIINRDRKKHNSMGLQITEKRIELLSVNSNHGTVKIHDLYENELASGTRVEISMPLDNDDIS